MEGTGRGRGLAILQALKKKQQEDSASSSSGSPSATTSVAPSATPSATPSAAPSADPSAAPSAVLSTAPSAAPSEVSSSIPPFLSAAIGGRGRAFLMSRMQAPRPGGGTIVTPASDSDPSPQSASMRGMGRGLKMLQAFEKAKAAASSSASAVSAAQSDVEQLTETMEGSTLSETTTSSTPKPKNKYFREIKDSPPVVKKGDSGRQVPLTANYIRMSVEPGMGVFEYEVRFDPPIDYRGMCLQLLKEHLNVIGQTRVFDGTTLYVPKQLPDEVTVLKSNHPVDGTLVHIKVIFRRARRMGEVIHLYNVLFKNIMRELDLVRMNREHYNPRSAMQIPQHKLEVWPGYVTAVDEYEGGLMLTLDSKHRVLRTEIVLDFLQKTMLKDRANFRQVVVESLVGHSVMTTYNKKLYRVDDIDLTKNPMSEFSTNDDETISFVDYYKKQYNIDIKDLQQPLLISKQSKRIRDKDGEKKVDFIVCLVPELCVLTGLSDEMRTNFRLMKDVATHTRITPNQRYHAFKKFLENIYQNQNASQHLAKWGLKIDPDTINIVGRTLPPEPLTFGNNITTRGSPNADWGRDATSNPVYHAVDLLSWAILYTRKDTVCTQDFIDTLLRCGGPMGIRINKPQMVLLQSDSSQQYVEQIKRACEGNIQMIVAVCPSQRDDRYASIKRVCNIHHAIPSQVVVARTLMNRDKIRAIVQKIALQMNCKLGGTLWTLHIPIKSAMIIGIDSYHEKGGKYKSVCGFVASYDESFTRWYSRVVLQNPREEIVEGLKCCLVDALHFFQQHRGHFPQKIIVYRDGVGDGQLKEVQNFEIKELKSLFTAVATDYSPTLTFIVVQKRINTRMFLKSGSGMENPAPGTVLDYDITRRDWYDFLIVSQKVGQGTVTPSHYIVLEDGSNMKPDQVQRLTYKLCHLYYNWPGTVRVPAPCQYAHKLAYLVGEHMRQAHDIKLADKLFFL